MDNKTIVGYPLNGVYYNAEDAQTYLCTRTSGIYSSEDNFRFGGVVNNRYVVIQPGLAWMKVSQFGGISFALKEAVQVYVEGGGDTDRTDLIVLRYDGNQNECSVAYKKNSISVDRDNNIFELGLYKVFVEAGSTQIIGLGSDVQDVRLTELCGIMKDGVTGIPVENLVRDFEIEVQNSIDTLNSDAQEALSDFEADAGERLDIIQQSANILLGNFVSQSSNTLAEANAKIEELNQTEEDFNNSVMAANNAVENFNEVTAPNAIAGFDTTATQALDAFETKANDALEELKESTNKISAGADVMLQTAFNKSGRVGQVSFEEDTKIYICGVANIEIPYPRVVFPFADRESREELLESIRRGANIVFRLFTVKTAGDYATPEEEEAAYNFINNFGGDFDSVFDTSKPAYDFRLMRVNRFDKIASNVGETATSLMFVGMMDFDYEWSTFTMNLNATPFTYIYNLSFIKEQMT